MTYSKEWYLANKYRWKKYKENSKQQIREYLNKRAEVERIYHLKYMHYKSTGGLRFVVLERDGWKCVRCGMNNDEHVFKFGVSLTIDHINKNRTDNFLRNLQTLCLSCHSKKDGLENQFKKGKSTWNKGLKYTFEERRNKRNEKSSIQ